MRNESNSLGVRYHIKCDMTLACWARGHIMKSHNVIPNTLKYHSKENAQILSYTRRCTACILQDAPYRIYDRIPVGILSCMQNHILQWQNDHSTTGLERSELKTGKFVKGMHMIRDMLSKGLEAVLTELHATSLCRMGKPLVFHASCNKTHRRIQEKRIAPSQ